MQCILDLIKTNEVLFHYTKFETAKDYIIPKMQLKLSLLSQAGDPHEYKTKLINLMHRQSTKTNVTQTREEIREKFKKKLFFCSFCQSNNTSPPTKFGHLKSRMWQQYGDSHNGTCLVFSKADLIKNMKNVASKENFFLWHKKIEYKNPGDIKWPTLKIKSEIDRNNIDDIFAQTYKETLFTKDKDYKDENEYRLYAYSLNEDSQIEEIFVDVSHCLKAVICGDRCSKNSLKEIYKISKQKDIECLTIKWDQNKFDFAIGKSQNIINL